MLRLKQTLLQHRQSGNMSALRSSSICKCEFVRCIYRTGRLMLMLENLAAASRIWKGLHEAGRGEVFDIMCMEATWYVAGTINRKLYIPFRMTQGFDPLRTNPCGRPSL